MKAILLFTVLLFASSYAFEPFLFEEGHKFLDFLKDYNHQCYVIFFKNSNANGTKVEQSTLDDRNNEQQKAVEAKLENEPNVSYAVIDVGDPDLNDDEKADIDEFFEEARIERSKLDSYPITTVMDDGVGAYIWGPKHELILPRVVESFRHGRFGNDIYN